MWSWELGKKETESTELGAQKQRVWSWEPELPKVYINFAPICPSTLPSPWARISELEI